MSSIGENIRAARRAHGWSQEKLAQLVGVKKATISRYENGSREPRSEQLKEIAVALGVTAAFLQGYETLDQLSTVSQSNLGRIISCIQHHFPEITYEDCEYLIDLISCFASINDRARDGALFKLRDFAAYIWNQKDSWQD